MSIASKSLDARISQKPGRLSLGARLRRALGSDSHDQLEQIIAGMNNQSSMINEKLGEIILALSHEASLINSNPQLEQLIAGINNQSSMINDKFAEIILFGLNHQSALINGKSEEIILGIRNLSALINDNFNAHNGTQRALLLDDDEAGVHPRYIARSASGRIETRLSGGHAAYPPAARRKNLQYLSPRR